MKKVMLFYPPGNLYQRGEDRSQGNIEDSTATAVRACNDLGYASASLKAEGFQVFLRDYQTERLGMENLLRDFRGFAPDAIFVSITNATIFKDIETIKELKKINPSLTVILKGALFFNPEKEMLEQLDLEGVDYLIGGESDFIVSRLIKAHFHSPGEIPSIRGILYKGNGSWSATDFSTWEEDLDSLPFPDRYAMNNALYVRPDTGEPQATIATSRGCPAPCIFCLTPEISGRKVRLRSPGNIFEEIRECYEKHGIRNFFFKSDTFTLRRQWAEELCALIVNSPLSGKIHWVANSRTNPLVFETLKAMKEAGCWLVAFGYESGSEETLRKIKKGATVEDNLRAAEYAKKAGLKTFGFFLIGLPWEGPGHLEETKKLIFKVAPDFLEIHIAIPYYGTPLYEMAKEEGLIDRTVLGKDYFNAPTIGTKFLSIKEIEDFKKKTLLLYHLRPRYIMRRLLDAALNPKILINNFKYGLRLLRKNLR